MKRKRGDEDVSDGSENVIRIPASVVHSRSTESVPESAPPMTRKRILFRHKSYTFKTSPVVVPVTSCATPNITSSLPDEDVSEDASPVSSLPHGTLSRDWIGWETVSRQFRMVKKLGSGAYGVVGVAVDRKVPGRHVAIKRITDVLRNKTDARRILREMRILRQLDHPNIVNLVGILEPLDRASFKDLFAVYDILATDMCVKHVDYLAPYILRCGVPETPGRFFCNCLCANLRLHAHPAALLHTHPREKLLHSHQTLTDQHTRVFMFQLMSALRFLKESNVLHRDIKPANILISLQCHLRLCDFGLARFSQSKEPRAPNPASALAMDHVTPPSSLQRHKTVLVVTRWYVENMVYICHVPSHELSLWP